MPEKDPEELENLLKITREDLKELEKYIQEFSDFMPLPVCTVNPMGVLVDVNKAFQDLSGFKEMEVVGEKASVLFENKEVFGEIEGSILGGKNRVTKEMLLVAKGEEIIPVRIFVSVRKDEEENVIGYFLAISDISESKELQQSLESRVKKRTEEAEKRAEELKDSRKALMNILEDVEEARRGAEEERDKTLAIINNFPEGLLFFNKDEKLTSVNPRAKEIFNVKEEDVLGKNPIELKEIDSLKPLIGVVGEELRTIRREELEMNRNLMVEVSTIKVDREEGAVGTLVTIRDVTREKIVQRMKTEFVSIAAHQLRTPLSAIKWTLRMILDGDTGDISSEQKDLLEKTYQSNERMIRLINDLLNVTRIEEGRFLYETKERDIIQIAKEVIDPLKKIAERKGLEFKVNLPSKEVPKVKVDAEKFSLVVQNLVENAIHYTKNGSISISAEFKEEESQFLFKVKDSGIGIAKDEQERIFTKFFRSSNAMKSETEGTGLGLFIAKNIIEAHNGRIWFDSEKGKGATFYFTLPVKRKGSDQFSESI